MDKINIIPDFIIKMYQDTYDTYPSITQTSNVIFSGVEQLTKKNKIIWFYNLCNKNQEFIKDALIEYNTTHKIMVYVSAIDVERVYKLYILSTTESKNNVDILLNGLNKFYTIDF